MSVQEPKNIQNAQELHSIFVELCLTNDHELENQTANINALIQDEKIDTFSALNHEDKNYFKLKELKLCNYDLTQLPLEVCQLKYLTSLNLSHNLLESLPNEIGNLCNLVSLNLSGNKLNCLPKTLRNVHPLNFLDISHNEFFEVPDVFCYGLRMLKVLDLSYNEIGSFKDPPASINNLIALDLSNNAFKQLPAWVFSSFCHLQTFNISKNPMYSNSEVLVSFYRNGIFESLQLLNIENCNYSCKNIQILGHFKKLEILHLGNKVLGNEKNKGNNYFGNFTVGIIENLKYVKYLYLQNVQIGSLPADFDSLKNIKILDLSCNMLSWLPDCFCNLSSLKVVNLTSNHLLFLPNNIGNLTNLQQLHLGNNKLEQIPESFYNLLNLEFVDFYNNNIVTIDEKIFTKKNLKGIDLELNCLNLSSSNYDSLKTFFRKYFGVFHCRSDAQMKYHQNTSEESSTEYVRIRSRCSTASLEGEKDYSDFEDAFIDLDRLSSQNNAEDEDWEKNSLIVEEDELFDPTENSVRQASQNYWSSDFKKNYCPANYHVPSLMTTYRRNLKFALRKEAVVDGQFDSD